MLFRTAGGDYEVEKIVMQMEEILLLKSDSTTARSKK